MVSIESQPPEDSFRLREYASVIWYRKWSIAIITIIALAAAVFFAMQQTPVFQSTARVLATNPLAAIQQNPLAQPNMDTEKSLMSSTTVIKCATLLAAQPLAESATTVCTPDKLASAVPLPGVLNHLNVSVPQNTNILAISYLSPKKLVAQASAEAFAKSYIWYKTTSATTVVKQQEAPLLAQQKSLNDQITAINKLIADAIKNGNTTVLPTLQARINPLNTQLQIVAQQLVKLSPSLINPPQLAADAQLPLAPAKPNKKLIAAVGLFLGLSLAIGLAFLRERLDDRLRGRSDLEEQIGVPVLAVIPGVTGWRNRHDAKLVTLEQPRSAASEAYRSLRTSVMFASVQRGVKTIMVTSPSAGEGKTTTAVNIAVSLAGAKKRVILVSADLRKPRVHKFFGLSNDQGLSTCLAGEAKPWEALQDPKVENLRVMSSGPVPGRPAELLQSEQMGELIAELREVADFVIIDTAPILLVADAMALAPLVDGVLFVSDAENTSRHAVANCREQMEQVNAPLLGAVLNNFDPAKARGYGYYGYGGYRYRYSYGYGRYGYGAGYGQAPEVEGNGSEGRRGRRRVEAPGDRRRG
jgi:capsular exopolysaccharide synthesis family protein